MTNNSAITPQSPPSQQVLLPLSSIAILNFQSCITISKNSIPTLGASAQGIAITARLVFALSKTVIS